MSQAIELENGSVLINSRGASVERIGSISHDFGDTFDESFYFEGLGDMKTGCEGSMVRHENSGMIYYSGIMPDVHDTEVLRYNMTVWRSGDDAMEWEYMDVIDVWSSAYSAMVTLPKQSNDIVDAIGILYENAEIVRTVFIPDHISLQLLTYPHNLSN